MLEANVTWLCRYLEQHFPFRWRVVIGDARFFGSAAPTPLDQPVVGIAPLLEE